MRAPAHELTGGPSTIVRETSLAALLLCLLVYGNTYNVLRESFSKTLSRTHHL